MQIAEDYVRTLSATSGLPFVMVRRNMQKIHHALTNMRTVLNGLTRGLPLEVIDTGFGEQSGARVSYYPTTQALGLVMPSNSPAVNSLWLPAIALKTPVVIKPGREEPWTPYRLIQAFIAAGAPAEAFGFYPTDHEGSGEVMKICGRALIFGDVSTVEQYRGNAKFSVHGPGWSKILIGDDEIENWREYIDLMASSIAENGGRSCINASAVVVPKYAAEIADALAQKLGPIAPAAPEDEQAKLSGFANPKMAEFIDSAIESGLETPGADRRDREIPRRPAQGRRRPRPLSAPDHRALRELRASAGEQGIPLPVRERGADSAGRNAREDRPVAGRHRDHEGPRFHRAAPRLRAHRAAQSRPDPHDENLVGPAARGEHVRVPVQAAVDREGVVDGDARMWQRRNMPSISVTLPDDVEEELRVFAEERGSTLIEVMTALAQTLADQADDKPVAGERLVDISKLHPEIQLALRRIGV